jgi:hypothetical protein
MIPRTGPRVELLPSLKLYREDLDKFLSLFRDQCQQVTFGDEEHLYESLDEMEGRTSASLRCFVIQGLIPHVEVVIRGSYTVRLAVQRSTLFVVERNPQTDLLFLSVKDFLHSRQWFWGIVLRKVILTIGIIATTVCVFSSKSLLGMNSGRNDLVYTLAFLFSFGVLIIGVLIGTKQVSHIRLHLRSKSQSFWERNGNSIAMMIIGAAIGVVGTLVTEWLKHKLTSNP